MRTGSFRDGRAKLLVDFMDEQSNKTVGDWCPAWHDVERIVLSAVDVEQTNDGDYVEMLGKVEERLAKRLPKLGIARHRALLHSYEPPFVEVALLDHDRPGWGPWRRLRLTCPIAQALLDLVIAHELLVYLVVRDDTITDIRAQVTNTEVSIASIAVDAVKVLEGPGSSALIWA